jgi:hypothetical protein
MKIKAGLLTITCIIATILLTDLSASVFADRPPPREKKPDQPPEEKPVIRKKVTKEKVAEQIKIDARRRTLLFSSIKYYGNWGGRNWSGGAYSKKDIKGDAEPIDSMDKLFKAHDEAYARAENSPNEKRKNNIIRRADETLLQKLKALPELPSKWDLPPPHPVRAATFRREAIAAFEAKLAME